MVTIMRIAHLYAIVFMSAVSFLSACQWCSSSEKIAEMRSSLASCHVQEVLNVLPQSALAQDYVAVYFPQAQRITSEYFKTMCSKAIYDSLGLMVELLSKNPWAYFKNKPDWFVKGHHWEKIIDQCLIFRTFFKEYVWDFARNELVEYESLKHAPAGRSQTIISLPESWRRAGDLSHYYKFHALLFDLYLCIFNEQVRYATADKKSIERLEGCAEQLHVIFRSLKGWSHEQEYALALKRVPELVAIAKNRLSA